MFGTSISSSMLGKTQTYGLNAKTSNIYKSASISNTILDYSKFGTTWIENKNIPKGFSWSYIAISSTQPNENKNIKYGQFQSVTFENNTKNIVAIFYSHNLGKTWNQVKITNINLLNNTLDTLYKWTNIKMSDDGMTQIVLANDKYMFKSYDYGVTWVLDQEFYNKIKDNSDINLISMTMSTDANSIYISGINQPLYIWNSINNITNKREKILEQTYTGVYNAYNAMGLYLGYLDNITNTYIITNTSIDVSILYYYYNIISDYANIAYTINDNTIYPSINTIMNNAISLFKLINIILTYIPNINNQFSIKSGWNIDLTNFNNSIVGCSNDGNIITTISQTSYPYTNTLVINTINTTNLSSNITLSDSILSISNNNHFFELNTASQRIIHLALSNTGQYQTIVLLNNENITTHSIISTTGILYSNDFGKKWQYAIDAKTKSIQTLKNINWMSVVISYSGQYQTAISHPSYINKDGYIYYSYDFGKSWNQSSGITGAPNKYWTGLAITNNSTLITTYDQSYTGKKYNFNTPEGYIQSAISKDGKLYICKFNSNSLFEIEQVNMGSSDTAQLIVAIDDASSSQNTNVN